nr:hypothetical protein [uncultured Chryseobacterium sp.]
MKKVIAGALALSLSVAMVSCKKETKIEASVGKDSLNTTMSMDSTATPKTDSTATSSATKSSATTESIITKNGGKYPHEIKLFEDKALSDRLKKVVGKDYDEMVKSFNVESPIVSEDGIYKLHGCKQHDCPGYATSIYYDSKNDNLNVSIDKNGKVTDFAEKGKIAVSKTLETK